MSRYDAKPSGKPHRKRLALLGAGLGLAACPQLALAQTPPSPGLATYAGADRLERLVAAAKKEGPLTLYTTFAATNLEIIVADFERRHGVKVNHWRSGTLRLMQRVLAETKASRYEIDAILFGAPEMEGLHREKLLQEVRSPHHKSLADGLMPSHATWAPVFLNLFAHAYHTEKVKREELPRNYLDLLQ